MFNKKYIFIVSYVLILIIITLYCCGKMLFEKKGSLTTLTIQKEPFDNNTLFQSNQHIRGYIDQKLEFLNNSGNSVYNEVKLRMDSTIYASLLLTTVATLLLLGVLNMKLE